ncbi:MAG: hypothetical protein PHV42_04115 [Candidatus Pacebacteria bacterium]|nr:hypothetical protein [Candidatus Paceibacterota bacterium]
MRRTSADSDFRCTPPAGSYNAPNGWGIRFRRLTQRVRQIPSDWWNAVCEWAFGVWYDDSDPNTWRIIDWISLRGVIVMFTAAVIYVYVAVFMITLGAIALYLGARRLLGFRRK